MADEEKKQPLSLNQLHNRFLLDLSASQSNLKTRHVDKSTNLKGRLGEAFESTKGNFDVPRFDLNTPSPPVEGKSNVEENASELQDSYPRLFGEITDFSSSSSTMDSKLYTSGKITEEDASYSERNSTISSERNDNSQVSVEIKPIEVGSDKEPENEGEGKQMKVKIEGRRRLCRISRKNDNDEVAQKNITRDEHQQFDGVSDSNSPLVDKSCKINVNEIRDILNDLSSRLETLSIQKDRAANNVDLRGDPLQSLRGQLHDISIKWDPPKFEASSSNFLSSDSEEDRIEPKVATFTANNRKEKPYNDEMKGLSYVGEVNRAMHKGQTSSKMALNIEHVKSRSSKKSQAHNYSSEERHLHVDYNVDLSEKCTTKQVNRQQWRLTEVSDEGSDDVTLLDDHVDDFILSGSNCTYKLPGKIAKILYPHQLEGLKWLWSLHCRGKGGILGDDMGLGKTMQMCSFLAGLFNANLIRKVLVVAPKTLLTHWINELSTVGLARKTREYFATCTKTRHYELQYVLQDKGVLLTTYDIVRNNVKSLCGDHHYGDGGEEDKMTWDYMILDEGHLIKNPSTQRAKSLLQIPCLHRIIISGTPLQNNLKELWALFSFCCPELLGDKNEFKERYEHFINRGNEKNASEREKRIGSSVAKDLRDCIQPYFLRRMKSEVFRDDNTLSKKNEIIVWLRLTRCQRQLYEAFLKSEIVISACDGSPLAALTILKKICDHPLLLTKRAAEDVLEGMESIVDKEDHRVAEKLAMHVADVAERFDIAENHDISCKISFILSLLGDLIPKGHNVLIFSQTRKMLNLIQESLVGNHYKCMRIDGTTKAIDRSKLVKDFQEGRGSPIFLLTTQVGGLGLTLTKADRVIVVDPAWNPSTDNQSVDRAYRIGQKKDVIVYRLMTCGTVEEKIYRKQVFKGGLFRSATEHKEQIRYFSRQDLQDLFSLPKQGFDVSSTQQQLLEEHDDQHKMEESLRAHVEFLKALNIAGVSQHSLLFSKTAPLQAVEIDEEVERPRSKFFGNAPMQLSHEHDVDGACFAFNPKDIRKFQKNSSPEVREPTEEEIRDRINRLSSMFEDKVTICRLPDKGAKLNKQIAALNRQLNESRMAKANKENIIEL